MVPGSTIVTSTRICSRLRTSVSMATRTTGSCDAPSSGPRSISKGIGEFEPDLVLALLQDPHVGRHCVGEPAQHNLPDGAGVNVHALVDQHVVSAAYATDLWSGAAALARRSQHDDVVG